ncbi:MAG: glyoxalase/bleomycin resistance/dioxygenase family protein [Saprospiraceae bacterium]|nr:glyoxalase/bleomycin resistance/dioxygenase family protein [Saprospiraceae bacterium]
MDFDRTGIILYVLHYQECVHFYKDILALPVLFETRTLICFSFGGSYLMVEIDDEYEGDKQYSKRLSTCLRMNVANVKILAQHLMAKNISVDYQEHPWGTVAKFFDPDGNLCSFKDSKKFEIQVNEYKDKLK